MGIIGADPGRFGAIALIMHDKTAINVDKTIFVTLCSVIPDDNPDELARLLARYAEFPLALEMQSPLPRQGAASAGKLMWRAGIIRGVAAGLGMPVIPVWPVQWRRMARIPIGADKKAAVALARAVPGFNAAVAGWSQANISGAADAVWIAQAGMRLMQAGLNK